MNSIQFWTARAKRPAWGHSPFMEEAERLNRELGEFAPRCNR
jgi:hypothetical protein